MKKYFLPIVLLILVAMPNIFAQSESHEKNVIVTYTWTRISTHGSNQIAIWIEDVKGKHLATLFATKFTTQGGYIKRPVSLSEWTAKFDLKNASKEDVDAITGATPQSGAHTLTWNCKDKSGKTVSPGTYIVRMEANILDPDKMFFRGEIEIGASDNKTSGETTFSRPELADGNVLFKDVLIEYK
jgi:hypothetical protein